MASRVAERLSFAKIPEVLPLPDLLAVQHESFKWFLDEGLREIFEEISPIEDFTGSLALELTDHRFGEPPLTLDECKERDQNYARPLFVTARFMNRGTGEIKEQQVFLGDFPMMTENGVFVINGTERVVVSQLVRSPGVYFDETPDKGTDRMIYSGRIIPGRGAWLEFDTDKRDTIGVRVDRKRRQYVSAFLRALSIAETDQEILDLFDGAESIRNTIERDTAHDKEEALVDLYRKLRPGEPTTVESARSLIQTLFRNPKRYDLTKVGRYKVAQKFNDDSDTDTKMLRDEDIVDTIKYLVALHAGQQTMVTHRGVEVKVEHRRHRPLRQPSYPHGRRTDPEPGAGRLDPARESRQRAHDHPGPGCDHPAELDQHPSGDGCHQGVLRNLPAQPVHGSAQPPGRPHASPPPIGPRARAACPVSAPDSRFVTCTPLTTGACARSRRPRVRTSASSAPWPPMPGSTGSASSRPRIARS